MSRNTVALVAAVFAALTVSAAALAAAWARPTAGHYAGPTSEQGAACSANFGRPGCRVTFEVGDHGTSITGFTTADGYNGMCHFTGKQPHIFQFLVRWSPMPITSNGSFTGTAKAKVGSFTGAFRVKGRFSSGKAHGTVTRVHGACGSHASNPTASAYAETFTAKRT